MRERAQDASPASTKLPNQSPATTTIAHRHIPDIGHQTLNASMHGGRKDE